MGNTETSTEVAVVPRVYYAYTKPEKAIFISISRTGRPQAKDKMLERATVAVKPTMISPDMISIVYGVSICSVDDNFNAEEGRKRALERLEKNFASAVVKRKPDESVESVVKAFLFRLTTSVNGDIHKYRTRLAIHTERAKATAKHPSVDVIV